MKYEDVVLNCQFTLKNEHERVLMTTRSVAQSLYLTYFNGFGPPQWVLMPDVYCNLPFRKTVVYYDDEDSLENVKVLTRMREPVNIGMKRNYNKQDMQRFFGWSKGAYGFLSTPEQLAPNIAIYNYTPIKVKGKSPMVHLIHLVGYAFDSVHQPDVAYFGAQQDKVRALRHAYVKVWRKAFECARQEGLKRIHMAKVGGGVFCPDDVNYDVEIYQPCVSHLKAQYPNIEIIEQFYPDFVVPDSLSDMTRDYLAETLFVNAWDPWSIPGNGNAMDNSLDGQWGRISACAVLSWPETNPFIRYHSLPGAS